MQNDFYKISRAASCCTRLGNNSMVHELIIIEVVNWYEIFSGWVLYWTGAGIVLTWVMPAWSPDHVIVCENHAAMQWSCPLLWWSSVPQVPQNMINIPATNTHHTITLNDQQKSGLKSCKILEWRVSWPLLTGWLMMVGVVWRQMPVKSVIMPHISANQFPGCPQIIIPAMLRVETF